MRGFTHGRFTFCVGYTALICPISLEAGLIPFPLMLNGLFIWGHKPQGSWATLFSDLLSDRLAGMLTLAIIKLNCFLERNFQGPHWPFLTGICYSWSMDCLMDCSCNCVMATFSCTNESKIFTLERQYNSTPVYTWPSPAVVKWFGMI